MSHDQRDRLAICTSTPIVLNEAHLCRLVTSYLEYYHTVRPHLSLERNAPIPRPKQVPSEGNVVAMPCVGGLHHGYRRVA